MKNSQIKNLKEVVPKEIRLQVYRDALGYFSTPQDRSIIGNGLCLVLPVFLWGLQSFYGLNAYAPDGQPWDYDDTGIAFPELTEDVKETIYGYDYNSEDAVRVNYLDQWISTLEADE